MATDAGPDALPGSTVNKPALCLAAPLPCHVPRDELSLHVAVSNPGTQWTQL